MRFSIYSELQSWPGKSQRQVYDEAIEQVVNADRLGYYAYAIIEHFFFPKFGASPNPLAFFAKCSERTKNIVFRTLVHVLPYHNPVRLAKAAATLDVLSGGRLIMGVGVGLIEKEIRAMGSPYAERGAFTDESIAVMRALWTQDEPKFDGKYSQFEGMKFSPKPLQKPSIPIGSNILPAMRFISIESSNARSRCCSSCKNYVGLQIRPNSVSQNWL